MGSEQGQERLVVLTWTINRSDAGSRWSELSEKLAGSALLPAGKDRPQMVGVLLRTDSSPGIEQVPERC